MIANKSEIRRHLIDRLRNISEDTDIFEESLPSLMAKTAALMALSGASAGKASDVVLIKEGFEAAYLGSAAAPASSVKEADEPKEAKEEKPAKQPKPAKRKEKKAPEPAPEPEVPEEDEDTDSFPDIDFGADTFGDEEDTDKEEADAPSDAEEDEDFASFDDIDFDFGDDDDDAPEPTVYHLFLRKDYKNFKSLMERLNNVGITPEIHYVEDGDNLKLNQKFGLRKAPSMAAKTGDNVVLYADIKAIVALMETLSNED